MMKKTIAALACVAIAAFAQNLLENPSFEEMNDAGMPAGWRILNNKKIEKALTVETEKFLDGKTAARIDNHDAENNNAQLIWQQYVSQAKFAEHKPGAEMELSVFAYAADKPAKGRIYLE